LKAANPELPVVVKGDTVVQYGKVMDVLELLGQLDITQLGLVTQRLVK
jgi:biopolymer transport protein ExbD